MSEAPSVEERAKELGWVPKEEFKGDPEKWRDAETYVQNGEEILPILRKTNEGLRNTLTDVQTRLATTEAALTESQEAINSFKEFHTEEVKARVAAAREKLKGELVAAKQAGDHAAEVELTDELGRLNAAEAAKPPPTETVERKVAPRTDPVFQAWAGENSWYGKDLRRTALMQGVASELRMSGDRTIGREFLEKCAAEVDRTLSPRSRDSKVEGSNGGGGEIRQASGGFAALPKEAQDACRARAAKFVGPNKAFKDEKSWQDYYTKQYNDAEGASA